MLILRIPYCKKREDLTLVLGLSRGSVLTVAVLDC